MVDVSYEDAAGPAAPAASAAPPRRWGLGSHGHRVLQAVGWSLVGYGASYGLRLVSTLIMTRLLVPEMFGVMAVAVVVQVVTFMLCDVGLRQAVIQSPRGDQQTFLDTAWTVQVVRGFIIWIGCAACAALIAWGVAIGWISPSSVYADSQLPWLIVVLSITSVILGFQSTKSMSSDRHLNQRQLAIIEFIAQSTGVAVSIALAYATRSIWSFVSASLVSATITVAMSQLPDRRHRTPPAPARRRASPRSAPGAGRG